MYNIHRYKRQARKTWRGWTRRYFNHHPFVVPTAGFLLVFFLASASFVAVNGQTVGPSDSRIVQVFVDGERQVVPTRAENVEELLKRLEVQLHEGDLVEPALNTPIYNDNFKVNVYRAKPVTIIDGNKKSQLLTTHEDPRLAVEKTGITLYPEDVVNTDRDVDFLHEGTLGKRLTIDRATVVVLNIYGSPVVIRTQANTVGEVLSEKNIEIASDDTVLPTIDQKIKQGDHIIVSRFGTKIDTIEEEIPFETETILDPAKNVGDNQITTKGVPGKRIVTYEIELKDGNEIERRLLQEIIVQEPVKEKITKGSKIVITNPSENVKIGERMAAEFGWTGNEWYCLYQLWQKESKWNQFARNPSGAFGIPQGLPLSGRIFPVGFFEGNVEAQVSWGLEYIKGRYESPCNAWHTSQISNSY